MLEAKHLTRSLVAVAGLRADKRANAFNSPQDEPIDSVALQEIVGDPDTHPLSWGAQFKPTDGMSQIANPLSPVQGDEPFLLGLLEGARMQANDGSWWDIESWDFEGAVTIRNVWYPRISAVISIQDLRRSIHSWIEPVLIRVPPLPAGAEYGVLQTKSV